MVVCQLKAFGLKLLTPKRTALYFTGVAFFKRKERAQLFRDLNGFKRVFTEPNNLTHIIYFLGSALAEQ